MSSFSLPRYRRVSSALLAVGLGISLCSPATALKRRDGEGAPTTVCPVGTSVTVSLHHGDLPLVGLQVDIDAAPATITELGMSGGDCTSVITALPQFQWQLVSRPAGSAASLANASTLHPKLTPDREGPYRVRFTACPGGCTIPSAFGPGSTTVAAVVRELTVTAEDGIAPPPETEPFVPVRPTAPHPDLDPTGCPVGADKVAAAWVTVEDWQGSDDYRTVAGKVERSKVSRKDNILNHDSQDHNSVIEADPEFQGLLPAGQEDLEIEWEFTHYPDRFWPTQQDRIAAEGYWIHDCAHGDKTEIHPPVMAAAQRPRAIEIPASIGLGTNVWVPGIITDVWVNSRAGEITRNCSWTGLHNVPFVPVPFFSCPPHSAGLTRNPIRKVLRFDILLPRNPQDVIAPTKSAPPVPLFIEVQNPANSTGPDPVIVPDAQKRNVLHVSADLTGFSGEAYSRRIVAGWAYPSPDNWGLRRWKLRIDSLDVHDDADGRLRGDGDWRFWINANNAGKEWEKIFHCNGCVHGLEDFNGRPWETDSPSGDRRFGPDLRLFPGQKILLHSGGFEEDWIWTDGTGTVTQALEQTARSYSIQSYCRSSHTSGCGSYDLNFEVLGGAPVTAELTPAGQALHDAYEVSASDVTHAMPLPPIQPTVDLPSEIVVEPGHRPVTVALETYFPAPEFENSLADIDDEVFSQQLERLAQEEPERLVEFLQDLRGEADEAFESIDEDEVLIGLAHLRDFVDPGLWNEIFGDLAEKLPELPKP